jgi:hypothetical protein
MSNVRSRLEAVKREGYSFRLGEYISQGFTIFGKNAAMFIGFALVSLLITLILRFIPYLGQLVSFCISGALGAGYFIVAHKTYRNEYADFSNFFDGFKDWLQIFLNTLIVTALLVVGLLPPIIFFFKNYGLDGDFSFQDSENISEFVQNFGLAYILLFFLVVIILSLLVMYAVLFIVFDKLNVVDALVWSAKIVVQNLLLHFIFVIIWGLIVAVSCIPLLLGLVVTVPAFYCSIYYAWQDITRHENEELNNDDLMDHLID